MLSAVFQPDDRRVARAAAFRRHPEFESARDLDRRDYRDEIAREIDHFDAMRASLSGRRILEGAWPC